MPPRRSRLSEDEIRAVVREAEAESLPTADLAAKYGVCRQTIYRWRQRFGTSHQEPRALERLTSENIQLKRRLTESELELMSAKKLLARRVAKVTSGARSPGSPSFAILIVEEDPIALAEHVELLAGVGYQVSQATSFEEGRRQLATHTPHLLIVDARLGSYNGLRLVLLGRIEHAELAAIVVAASPDPALQQEAARNDAACITKPINAAAFLDLVASKVIASGQRRRPRKHIAGGIVATVSGRPAKIVDVSYGGFNFEVSEPTPGDVPAALDTSLPELNLMVTAQMVWMTRNRLRHLLKGGAALVEPNSEALRVWRGLVDALPAANLV